MSKPEFVYVTFIETTPEKLGIARGWPAILSGLKSLLETGKVFRIPLEALGVDCH